MIAKENPRQARNQNRGKKNGQSNNTTHTPPLQQAALSLLDAGFSVLPCLNHPKKVPARSSWTELQKTPMTPAEVKKEFVNGQSIALIAGKVSGNLECLDFDKPDVYPPFMETLADMNPTLAKKLVKRQTPSGGFHLIYRSHYPVAGNKKLAMAENGNTWIETRGEGGYFLTTPSPGYKVIENSLSDTPVLSVEEVELLHSIARSFT